MVVAGGGAAVAMSGHFVKHHHTASAAWFQYKPPCPSHNPKGTVSKRGKARGSWKHEPCKPPPRPPCSSKGQISKAHAAGARPCTPPPCSFGKAHAAGGNSCTPHKPGGTTPTTETTTPVTTQAPVVPNVQSSPGSSVQPTHTVQKHKAKKHKAKKHLKRHSAKRHSAKKHSAKKH
jgi:hypothetical protein